MVDPGVGGGRLSIALRSGDGRLFVGPDNGLLVPAAEKLGGIEAAHEITNQAYLLDHVSATFHGRDVFSPAAAHLVGGVALEDLGPRIEPASLVRLEVPEAGRDAPADPRLVPLRRPLREHAAEPDAQGSRGARARARHPRRARDRVGALLRGHRADVRGCARRRDHRLRGRLREHRDRDQRRQRGGHVLLARSPVSKSGSGWPTDARTARPEVRAVHDEPGRAPAAALAALPVADAARSSTGSRPRGTSGGRPRRSHRSRRLSMRSTRARSVRSISAPARVELRFCSRSAIRRPRSSASTWRRTCSPRPGS